MNEVDAATRLAERSDRIRGLSRQRWRAIHCHPMEIVIIGVGYVGLPLTVAFAEAVATLVDAGPRNIGSSQQVNG